jgi:DNA transposition AAA+ family ATPase
MSLIRNRYPEVDTAAKSKEPKEFDEALQSQLETYRKERGLSMAGLAAQLGCHESAVSKYLSGKPAGNVKRFESIASDVMKNAERQKNIKIQLLATSVSRDIHATLDTIRKTNDFGLITGNAGIGKTCGIEKYLFANPSAVRIVAYTWCANGPAVFDAIWNAIDQKWKGNISKITYLVERFRNSDRLLLIDNAHRLRNSGLKFLFDFHDETGIPICLVGNPEIVDVLKRNDQQFSRIGLHKHFDNIDPYLSEPGSGNGPAPKVAKAIINQIAPQFADCETLAEKVIAGKGHARALRKQLSLADELASSESFKKNCPPEKLTKTAFAGAHKKLIRDYDL